MSDSKSPEKEEPQQQISQTEDIKSDEQEKTVQQVQEKEEEQQQEKQEEVQNVQTEEANVNSPQKDEQKTDDDINENEQKDKKEEQEDKNQEQEKQQENPSEKNKNLIEDQKQQLQENEVEKQQEQNVQEQQQQDVVVKKKKKIFEDNNDNKPALTLDLTVGQQQYQTELNSNINPQQIQQFQEQQEKAFQQQQQQVQQQFGKHYHTNQQGYQQNAPQQQQQLNQQPQEIDEHYLLTQQTIDRKKENFNLLKDWDQQRAQFLNSHRNILEQIQGRVDQLLMMSANQMEIIIKFFQSKGRQEINYSRTPLPKPKAMLEKNPLATNTSVYRGFTSLMENFDQANQENQKKVQEFAVLIEISILKDTLIKDYDEQNKEAQVIRDDLIEQKKKLYEANAGAQNKSQKFSLVHHATIRQHENINNNNNLNNGFNQQKKINKDLYKKQLGFQRVAESQREIQRIYAKQTLDFWLKAKQLEQNRVKAIQQALKMYSGGFQRCYGQFSEILGQEHQNLLDTSVTEEQIEEIYSITSILNPQELEHLREQLGKEKQDEVKFGDLQKYFEKFVIQDFTDRMLIMKEWNISREITPNCFQDSKMVVTVDKFLQCFDVTNQIDQFGQKIQDKKYRKPSFSLFLGSNPKLEPLGGGMVKIKVNPKGFMLLKYLNPKEANIFKFKSDDCVEEFIQLIENL